MIALLQTSGARSQPLLEPRDVMGVLLTDPRQLPAGTVLTVPAVEA